MRATITLLLLGLLVAMPVPAEMMAEVTDHYADNDGVKIHYVTAGEGPLVLFIHGWPDFWYTWRAQMDMLKEDFTVAAMDCRGYNLSDQPEEAADYAMPKLLGDVAAVIKDQGQEKAIIVGHDWGGAIAWQFAMAQAAMVDKLIIVNLPHPAPLSRELANNPDQQEASGYAQGFQAPDSHEKLNAKLLAGIAAQGDKEALPKYLEAFERSSFNGMMNYYRMNYPKAPYEEVPEGLMPQLTMPVLQFHGLKDTALLAGGLSGTWDHMAKDYTLVTLPDAGHWAHRDAADTVSQTMTWWLLARQ